MRTTKLQITRTLVAAACTLACLGAQAAKINISSRDAPGTGFGDPTPAAPVGGNPGLTVGEQRMNVYRYVADIWEQALQSNVSINVSAGWEALTCDANSAVLGSAGAWNIWRDFPNSVPGTWYPQALANKLSGMNLSDGTPDDGSGYGNFDIKTQFNVNLGNAGCLTGTPFYLGLDGQAAGKINFVETLLHELGHGLGFSVLGVQTSTGNRLNADGSAFTSTGLPSIWERFMYDNSTGKTWLQMSSAERKASAINPLKLAWSGPNAVSGAAMLTSIQVVKTASPAPGGSRFVDYSASTFGPPIQNPGALGALAVVATQAGEIGPGCSPFNVANATAVAGKVAIISRGACPFAQKVKNAQNAGAIGVLLANNAGGAVTPGGADPTISIPSAGITQADGDALRAAVAAAVPYGTRSKPGYVTASWSSDPNRRAGADLAGRPLLYTPNPLVGGSSVSHWDVTATPNLLMEPNINPDLGTILVAPKDLTVPLLKDIGW